MNMALKKGVLGLLLMLGMASVFAWPGERGQGAAAYEVQFRPYAQQRGGQDGRGQDGRGDYRRGRGDGDFQRPRRDADGDPDASRRGRMTPDERRDLRRQINEAGRDLYPARPSRR